MLRYFSILVAMLMVGCSSLQVEGTGRFFQATNSNGVMFIQTDYTSYKECRQEAISTQQKFGDKVIVKCSTVSNEKKLPFYFTVTNIITDEKVSMRAQTHEICRMFLAEAEKKPLSAALKLSECELQS